MPLPCPHSRCPPHGPLLPLQIREEQAEAERQQDVVYMRQQAAQLDKQERERQQLLEKVKAVQVGLARLPLKDTLADTATGLAARLRFDLKRVPVAALFGCQPCPASQRRSAHLPLPALHAAEPPGRGCKAAAALQALGG